MARTLRYLIGWLLLAATVAAQPREQPLRFTVFAVNPLGALAFSPRAGAPAQPVVFYPTARSPRYEYRGAMPLRFVEQGAGVVVAEATIPAAIRDALLIFTPLPNPKAGGLRYQVAVLDDGAARLAAGSLAIVNLSGLALAGTVGREAVTLRAGLNPALPLRGTTSLVFRTMVKERSYQSYAGTMMLARNQRGLLVLFPPFNPGSIEVQSRLLLDEPPAAAPRQ
jgi:hypothetical protein